jgi:hypothetical protein
MSDTENPYRSPEAGVSPVAPLTSGGFLTDIMLACLKGASPWLRFVGIVGFVGCGLTVLIGIIFLATGPAMGWVWETVPGINFYADVFGAVFGGVMGGYCLILGVLCFFPSFFIYNFGTGIRNYIRSGAGEELETAFRNNKSLWKFIGILTIIGLAFIPLSIIIGVVVGVAMVL